MVDPYYLSQREVTMGITELRSLLDNRSDILTDHRGGNPEIFESIGAKMGDGIRTVRGLLRDIAGTVEQVRLNRVNFQIAESELARRDSFVRDAKGEIDEIENQMNSQILSQKHQFQVSAFQPINPPIPEEPAQSHLQLQGYQEDQIDQIADTVKIQKQIGKEIIREINE
jgi:hypothetical protein